MRRPSLILKLPSRLGSLIRPFPADGGARFLEIHAHDDVQIVAQAFAQLFQTARIFQSGVGIVDGTRPDDYQQAIVRADQDVMDRLAGGDDGARRRCAVTGNASCS
jgi:hypothetical protein